MRNFNSPNHGSNLVTLRCISWTVTDISCLNDISSKCCVNSRIQNTKVLLNLILPLVIYKSFFLKICFYWCTMYVCFCNCRYGIGGLSQMSSFSWEMLSRQTRPPLLGNFFQDLAWEVDENTSGSTDKSSVIVALCIATLQRCYAYFDTELLISYML